MRNSVFLLKTLLMRLISFSVNAFAITKLTKYAKKDRIIKTKRFKSLAASTAILMITVATTGFLASW